MDIDYGTRRTVVPLLVEDVAGSQTALKVEEIGAKVDKLESIIESTLPRGCLTHWRIVNKTTGELINQGMLNNALNNTGNPGDNSSVISLRPPSLISGYPSIILSLSNVQVSNVSFWIPKVDTNTQKVELYNPYDTTVAVFEVPTSFTQITTPIYLKHVPPYPSQEPLNRHFFYPNGNDVYKLQKAMGEAAAAETDNNVIGLLKSISNKL